MIRYTFQIIRNNKLLSLASLLSFISGSIFLWFGLNSQTPIKPPLASTTTKIENNLTDPDSSRIKNEEPLTLEGERVLVTKVIDGDTVELENGTRVRLIGIDTPETKDPRRSVQCFGKEASNETKKLLEGKVVILQKDVSETDKYNRLLRYIFLPLDNGQILFVNDYLVREGFALVLTYPPDVKYNEQFREAERQARENNKGLWGRC